MLQPLLQRELRLRRLGSRYEVLRKHALVWRVQEGEGKVVEDRREAVAELGPESHRSEGCDVLGAINPFIASDLFQQSSHLAVVTVANTHTGGFPEALENRCRRAARRQSPGRDAVAGLSRRFREASIDEGEDLAPRRASPVVEIEQPPSLT